jgi:hypothetical protein
MEVIRLEAELNNNLPDPSTINQCMSTTRPEDDIYHWAGYDECIVTYKKIQSRRKKYNELQLTIKIRTYYMGFGDTDKNNGYLKWSAETDLIDPDSKIF